MKKILIICLLMFVSCVSFQDMERNNYIKKHPELTDTQKTFILTRKIYVGIDKEGCELCMGNPNAVLLSVTNANTIEQYIYKKPDYKYVVHFKNDKCYKIQRIKVADK